MDRDSLFEDIPSDGTYSGPCRVVLRDPAGSIEGAATLRISADGRADAEMTVEGFDAPPEYGAGSLTLLALLSGSPPKREGGRTSISLSYTSFGRPIASLSVDAGPGTFTAASGSLFPGSLPGFGSCAKVSIATNDLAFAPRSEMAASYWLMPLRGPFTDHHLPRQSPPHVLTLGNEGYAQFAAGNSDCGLQIFGRGGGPSHPLASCDAIAFGELSGAPTTLEDVWAALPRGLIEALGFAVGGGVTAPWVELRSEEGQLARRLFHRFGRRLAEDGFGAFSSANKFEQDSGIGPFLEAFFCAEDGTRDSLIVPLDLIRMGTPGWLTVDDSISFLVRALDSICESCGIAKQDLLAELDENNRGMVRSVLGEAAGQLRVLGQGSSAAGRTRQASVIGRIESRVANAANKDRQFGLALRKLLENLRLHDADVLDRYFLSSGDSPASWTGQLGKMREEVIHKGHLRIADRRSLRYWFGFARHLHDLCKRIVLRKVGYRGFYQASTARGPFNYSVDWVRTDTEAKDLGFGEALPRI